MTELLRTGAQQLIASAVEDELLELLGHYVDSKDEQGRQVIVRNSYLPAQDSDGHRAREGRSRSFVTAAELAFASIRACCRHI